MSKELSSCRVQQGKAAALVKPELVSNPQPMCTGDGNRNFDKQTTLETSHPSAAGIPPGACGLRHPPADPAMKHQERKPAVRSLRHSRAHRGGVTTPIGQHTPRAPSRPTATPRHGDARPTSGGAAPRPPPGRGIPNKAARPAHPCRR